MTSQGLLTVMTFVVFCFFCSIRSLRIPSFLNVAGSQDDDNRPLRSKGWAGTRIRESRLDFYGSFCPPEAFCPPLAWAPPYTGSPASHP